MNTTTETGITTTVAGMTPETESLPVLAVKATRPGDIISVLLSPEEETRVLEIMASVNFNDTNTIHTFAAAPQMGISKFLDSLLSGVKTNDLGVAGDLAIALEKGLEELELEEMKKELDENESDKFSFGKFTRALPFVGKSLSRAEHFVARQQAVLTHFASVEAKAHGRKREIAGWNVKLDTELHYAIDYLAELKLWIVGGERKLLEGRADYERAAKDTEKLRDPLEAAKLHDLAQRLVQFEVRLINLYYAYTKWSTLTPTKVRMIQEAGNIEIANIFEAILNDIPDLKALVVEIAALVNIKRAQQEGKGRTNTRERMEQLSSELGHATYTTAKESQGSVLQKVEGLQHSTKRMLDTLRAGREIELKTKAQREEAVRGLIEIRETTARELAALNQ